MYRTYFDTLATEMYPSRLLHSFGVNDLRVRDLD